jgi:ankyrin repeat protein
MVKTLVRKGADLTHLDHQGWSPLHHSIWNESVKCIKTLLSSGSGLLNITDNQHMNPLMLACYKGNTDIVKMLIKRGADIYAKDKDGRTLIHWSIMSKNISLLEMLYKIFNRSLHHWTTPDSDGATPLHYATVLADVPVIDYLLSIKCDPTSCDNNGLGVIHWSTAIGSVEQMKCLMKDNSDILRQQTNQELHQPLHLAAASNRATACSFLIEEKVMINARDKDGYTPLHVSCRNGHSHCVSILLDHMTNHTDIDALTNDNQSPLHLASSNGHDEVVNTLLSKGVQRDKPSGCNTSCAIHLAVIGGHVGVMDALIKNGCSIDLVREEDGRSPLHIAALHDHLNCCQYLIKDGARINMKDTTNDKLTPLDLGLSSNGLHSHCVTHMIDQGAVTGGGLIHHSVVIIQRAWKRYVAKRRERVTKDWAARRIQYHVRHWLDRIHCDRERERRYQHAALVIQKSWLNYITHKKLLEESYQALKSKLNHQLMATRLIMLELEDDRNEIQLPQLVTSSCRRRKPQVKHVHHHHPVIQCPIVHRPIVPLFPSGELLFDDSSRKPLMKSIPRVPHVSKASNRRKTSVSLSNDDIDVHLPLISSDKLSTITMKPVEKLSTITIDEPFTIKPNDKSSVSALPPLTNTRFIKDVTSNGSVTGSTVTTGSKKSTGSSKTTVSGSKTTVTASISKRNSNKVSRNKTALRNNKVDSRDQLLMGYVERYSQLNEVLELLHQAKTRSYDGSYEDLKGHVKSALHEAIRLRKDTESMRQCT